MGAVSPEPMIASTADRSPRRGHAKNPSAACVEHHVRELDRVLGVDVVVALDPVDARVRERGPSPCRRPRASGSPARPPASSAGTSRTGVRDAGVDLRRAVVPQPAQDRDVAVEREPRARSSRRAATSKLASVPAMPGLGPVRVRAADVALDLAQRPARQPRWRERPRTPPSCRTRRSGSSQPPSTHTIPRVASGWRSASSRTTLPPHDWPATTGRSSPSALDHRREVVRDGRHVVAGRRASRSGRGRAGPPSRRRGRARRAGRRRRPTSARSTPGRGRGRTTGCRRRARGRARTCRPPGRRRRRPGRGSSASPDHTGADRRLR